MILSRFPLCFLMGLLASTPIFAADLFSAQVTVNGQTSQLEVYGNLEELIAQYKTSNLKQLPGYTPNAEINALLNVRGYKGLQIRIAPNSNTLTLTDPAIGFVKTFGTNASTRDQSRQELVEFFKGNTGAAVIKQLTHEIVKNSPVDPIIGNPASLAHTMTQASTDLSSSAASSAFDDAPVLDVGVGKAAQSASSIAVSAFAPRFGRYTQGGLTTSTMTLPLSYSTWLNEYNMGLLFDAPITISQVENSTAMNGSLGVGLNFMLMPDWYVMPTLRLGLSGSRDLGAAAAIYSAGVNSTYILYPNKSSSLSIINMIAHYKTNSISLGEYKGGYDLSNNIFRNGVEYKQKMAFSIQGRPVVMKAQLARTDYTGDALYSSYVHDASLSFGIKNSNEKLFLSEYRLGMTYTFGDGDIRGVSFNLGYSF